MVTAVCNLRRNKNSLEKTWINEMESTMNQVHYPEKRTKYLMVQLLHLYRWS